MTTLLRFLDSLPWLLFGSLLTLLASYFMSRLDDLSFRVRLLEVANEEEEEEEEEITHDDMD